MYENAQKIFEYLPIRSEQIEQDYIQYLWETFAVLDNTETSTRSFSIMPLHLLFMTVIQYKVLRIYRERKDQYTLALTIKNPRNGEEGVLSPESPLALAFLGESEIIDLLKVVGLLQQDVKLIKKSIIRYRNENLAHAKGYIEPNIDAKIEEYLNILKILQRVYVDMNKKVAQTFMKEINENGHIDMDVMFKRSILDFHISPIDFGVIINEILKSEEIFLFLDQFQYLIDKGLEYTYDDTVAAMKIRVLDEVDDDKRLYLVRTLVENNEIDEDIRKRILIRTVKRAHISEIKELLHS